MTAALVVIVLILAGSIGFCLLWVVDVVLTERQHRQVLLSKGSVDRQLQDLTQAAMQQMLTEASRQQAERLR